MNSLTGTGALLRLALRLDRIRLAVWVVLLALIPAGTAAQYAKLYPSPQSLEGVRSIIANPSLVALSGPLFRASLGGLTAWKIGVTELILAALMSVFTVVRHSRAEEESGRLEMLTATVVGRGAPLTAAILTAGLANLAIAVLVALGLAGTGLPLAGSAALGAGIGLTGLVFTAVAAVTAQLTQSARTATALATGTLAAAYLLRAVGDVGPTALSWLSPIGWALRMRPFGDERWWVVGLAAGLVAVLLTVAYRLSARRDLGAGLLPERTGAPAAGGALRGAFGLAWRLHRGQLVGWLIGMAVGGAVLGAAGASLVHASGLSPQLSEMLARMGGRKEFVDEYLAVAASITGLLAAAYAVQATQRMRAEEASGRLEPLLATSLGRLRWGASHLVFAILGAAALLAVGGTAAGLAYGLQVHDPGQIPRVLAATLVQVPAVWVLAGVGAALFGLVPRLTSAAWAALVACLLLLELGALLGLSHWVVDASPFAHVPKLPGSAFHPAPLLWLVALAVLLVTVGAAGLRRRDIG